MSTWTSSQNTRIFGWTDILARWNAGLRGVAVDTVLNNLSSGRQFPAQHYFTYMNEEQDALKWFIYECVASSWMWNSSPRTEYIRVALDLVENVDSNFPVFPGSPAGTVRQFLTANLNAEQLDFVQMMPPLVRQCSSNSHVAQMMPPLVRQCSSHSAQSPVYAKIIFNVMRDPKNSKSDDVIVIERESEETYRYTYTDKTSMAAKKSCRHSGLGMSQVMALLSNLLNLLLLDDEPFYALQLELPSTPSVMLKTTNLDSATRDLVYDSVKNVMDSWPVMV